jgi:hypothetical protein
MNHWALLLQLQDRFRLRSRIAHLAIKYLTVRAFTLTEAASLSPTTGDPIDKLLKYFELDTIVALRLALKVAET